MKIIYIIGGVSPEYEGWLQINSTGVPEQYLKSSNNDWLRRLVINHVDKYMLPAGQKYRLYWYELSNEAVGLIYRNLERGLIPRYRKSKWFNTDVWTIRKTMNPRLMVYNCRRLKPINFAKYLNHKYQLELQILLEHPDNFKEQRFKRDFYSTWQLSPLTPKAIQRIIKMFSAYLMLRNLVNSVPSGCLKMFRKLIPLRIDDLNYDLKLLDYKFKLNKIIKFRHQINSLPGKPFGTAEFTDQYLIKHTPFLQIFKLRDLKTDFNL